MKIGILTGSVSRNAGGTFEAVRSLALKLQENPANQISVFGLRDAAFDADLPAWGTVPVFAFAVRGPHSFGYADDLYPAISQAPLDLLHVHGLWMYPSVVARKWQSATGAPTVISPHGMLDPWALANSGWKKKLAAWLYENDHLRRGACIHALCDAEATAIRRFGLNNPICVIPNGIAPLDGSAIRVAAWRDELPPNAKILLYLGRLHPKKGLANLVAAWTQAKFSAGPSAGDWYLVIAGWDQGGYRANLEALATRLGSDKSMRFVGPQFNEDKAATYRASNAFVLPSVSEGLPLVVLEAWAHGLPVFMTPQCNLEEGFSAGAAVRTDADVPSIARSLHGLFDMPANDLQSMGERGRQLVRAKFNWLRLTAEMEGVYSWLLGARVRPDCIRLH